MNKAYIISIISAFITLYSSVTKAQEIIVEEIETDNRSGYVNFNVGKNPQGFDDRQEVSLYGCNTEATTRIPIFNGQKNLEWDAKNQVLPGVPYGYREEGGKRYFVSKYYMPSPPVFKKNGKNDSTTVNIGLVIPDRFTFFGEKPVQIVNLDYEILEPVYLNFVDVSYDYKIDNATQSCAEMKVDLIPLNIQCKDFRWINKYSTPAIIDAKGASGIAQLRNDTLRNRVFLPSYKVEDEFLDCQITILDDIMLHHEVFFVNESGDLVKTINLTDFYKRNFGLKTKLNIACGVRYDLPAGCREND